MDRVFETNSSEKGFFSISSKYCKTGMKPHRYHGNSKIMIAAWKSSYASKVQNDWLEKRLYRIYKIYYWWVLLSNGGLFFYNKEEIQKVMERKEEVQRLCL